MLIAWGFSSNARDWDAWENGDRCFLFVLPVFPRDGINNLRIVTKFRID
ncbi:MAG: hypothetical protein AB4290_21650 [Spirulina sp.]